MFPANTHDITMFRSSGLKDLLVREEEKAIADKGYRGEPETLTLPYEGNKVKKGQMKAARTRHETLNNRFKKFNCLYHNFRHSIDLHTACLHAVAVIVQLQIEDGEKCYTVNWYPERFNETDSDSSDEDSESSTDVDTERMAEDNETSGTETETSDSSAEQELETSESEVSSIHSDSEYE